MFLCWNFAFCSVLTFGLAIWLTSGMIQRHGVAVPLRAWLVNGVLPLEATIFALAWWFIWKNRPSARVWGLAGSLILILNSLAFYLQRSRPLWVLLALGAIGIVAFAWRDEMHGSMSQEGGGTESAPN
jgi:hypothetical protein